MFEKLKPCPFCGGEAMVHAYSHDPDLSDWYSVFCKKCLCKLEVSTNKNPFYTKMEAVEAWNRRFAPDTNDGSKEQTAKVMEHDASVTDTDGYKYHRSEYLCGACKKRVLGGDDYCSHCGAKLNWSDDE